MANFQSNSRSDSIEGIADIHLAKGISDHYKKRLEKMVNVLKSIGFNAHMPKGTFYLYVKAPVGAENRFNNAEGGSTVSH